MLSCTTSCPGGSTHEATVAARLTNIAKALKFARRGLVAPCELAARGRKVTVCMDLTCTEAAMIETAAAARSQQHWIAKHECLSRARRIVTSVFRTQGRTFLCESNAMWLDHNRVMVSGISVALLLAMCAGCMHPIWAAQQAAQHSAPAAALAMLPHMRSPGTLSYEVIDCRRLALLCKSAARERKAVCVELLDTQNSCTHQAAADASPPQSRRPAMPVC